MSESTQRRLAAIVSADVVGYSRLMGADETGTLELLRAHRFELIDPLIEKHGGRIVKTTGDGMLLEFPSVVAAVECLVAVQEGMADRNTSYTDNDAIRFRVGVHLGDIIIDGGDIFGDGVNIAARLESLAQPGGICVSNDVMRQVQFKQEHAFADGGMRQVKNIKEPVHVWHWPVGERGSDTPQAVAGMSQSADKPSIAVLPFDNMSSDPEQEYFSDGITEDLITELSRFRQFHVIARNSTFTYKGRAVDIKTVGRELGARYVLEGSVRLAERRVRINAQLIEAETGNHVWAERYDRVLEDIFDVQDEITNTIAGAVSPAFANAELMRIRRTPPEKLDAWDLTLQAYYHKGLAKPADIRRACELAERAVALDPGNVTALELLAQNHVREGWMAYSPSPEASMAKGLEVARRALEVDNSDPASLATLGFALFGSRRFGEGVEAIRQAVTLNPNLWTAWYALGVCLAFSGEHDEAIEALDRAIGLSPRDPSLGVWICQKSVAAFIAERYEEGVAYGRQAVQGTPNFMGAHRALAANLSQLGRLDEAKAEVAELLRISPQITISRTRQAMPFRQDVWRERYCEALQRAGLPA